jgi:flagellar biosynthesis protein FlhG
MASATACAGRSVIAANLAVSLARADREVLVLDWGGGVKGAAWLLGAEPAADLLEVVRAGARARDAFAVGSAGVRVVAGARTAAALGRLPAREAARLEQALETLQAGVDMVIVDAAPNDLPACAAADELVVVTQADAQSMTETYRFLKRLVPVCGLRQARILINRLRIPARADRIFGNLSIAADRFLSVTLELEGRIPYDECMERSTQLRQVVVDAVPDAPASRALRDCAEATRRWPDTGPREPSAFAGRLVAITRDFGALKTNGLPTRIPE